MKTVSGTTEEISVIQLVFHTLLFNNAILNTIILSLVYARQTVHNRALSRDMAGFHMTMCCVNI